MKIIFEEERKFLNEKLNIDLPTDCWRKVSKIYLDPTCSKPLYTFKAVSGTIKITKDNSKLFEGYEQKKMVDLIKDNNKTIDNLVKFSVESTVDYILNNQDHLFVISHSGGKDSTVIYDIWLKALDVLKVNHKDVFDKLKWEINFSNTSNETADTYKIIKKLPKDKLRILNPKVGFYQWVTKVKNYFVPSVMVRNCCSTYKEGQITKVYDKTEAITMIIGVRKYESVKRGNYDMVMDESFRIKLFGSSNIPEKWVKFAPIIDWHDEEIWYYMVRENLDINKQYYIGFNRCGCLICPYQSDYIDLLIQEYYPKQWERWMGILEKNYTIKNIENRLKWSLEEWKSGKWKQGTSKEQEIIHRKATPERIKELAEIKGINEEMAEKYFNQVCDCGKKLNPAELAMSFKFYGRNSSKLECKKCFCENNSISSKDYAQKVSEFSESGCNLF